eukprot:2862945-Rhodomonas_salina.1
MNRTAQQHADIHPRPGLKCIEITGESSPCNTVLSAWLSWTRQPETARNVLPSHIAEQARFHSHSLCKSGVPTRGQSQTNPTASALRPLTLHLRSQRAAE